MCIFLISQQKNKLINKQAKTRFMPSFFKKGGNYLNYVKKIILKTLSKIEQVAYNHTIPRQPTSPINFVFYLSVFLHINILQLSAKCTCNYIYFKVNIIIIHYLVVNKNLMSMNYEACALVTYHNKI